MLMGMNFRKIRQVAAIIASRSIPEAMVPTFVVKEGTPAIKVLQERRRDISMPSKAKLQTA